MLSQYEMERRENIRIREEYVLKLGLTSFSSTMAPVEEKEEKKTRKKRSSYERIDIEPRQKSSRINTTKSLNEALVAFSHADFDALEKRSFTKKKTNKVKKNCRSDNSTWFETKVASLDEREEVTTFVDWYNNVSSGIQYEQPENAPKSTWHSVTATEPVCCPLPFCNKPLILTRDMCIRKHKLTSSPCILSHIDYTTASFHVQKLVKLNNQGLLKTDIEAAVLLLIEAGVIVS